MLILIRQLRPRHWSLGTNPLLDYSVVARIRGMQNIRYRSVCTDTTFSYITTKLTASFTAVILVWAGRYLSHFPISYLR